MTASVSFLRVVTAPETFARNLARMAGSARAVDVAERLGLEVHRGDAMLTMGADGAILGERIYVLRTVDRSAEPAIIAELAALVAIERLGVATADPFKLARETGACLVAMNEPQQRAVAT